MLKAEIRCRGFDRIRPSLNIEAVEIDPLLTEAKRHPHAAARQAQQPDLLAPNGFGLPNGKSEFLVKAGEPFRLDRGEPERSDHRNPRSHGRTQPRTLV